MHSVSVFAIYVLKNRKLSATPPEMGRDPHCLGTPAIVNW